MKKIDLTLNKANNVLKKLKKEISKLEVDLLNPYEFERNSAVIANFSFVVSDSYKDVSNNVEKLVGSYGGKIEKYLCFLKDVSEIKEKLFDANSKSGLNSILCDLEVYKKKLSFAETSLSSLLKFGGNSKLLSPGELTEELFKERVDLAVSVESTGVELLFRVAEVEQVESEISKARKRINKYEDAKLRINANSKISVSLSDYAMEFLGL